MADQEDYISITQAATEAGYRSPSSLRAAAHAGHLRTIGSGPHVRLTTRVWLKEYLESLPQRRRGWTVGQQRKGQDAGSEAGE